MVWPELYSLESTDKEKTLNWRSWNLVTNTRKFKRLDDLKWYICRTFWFHFFSFIIWTKYEESLKLVCFRLVGGIHCLSWTSLTTMRACLSSIKHSKCWPFWWVSCTKNTKFIPKKKLRGYSRKEYRGYSLKNNRGYSEKKITGVIL